MIDSPRPFRRQLEERIPSNEHLGNGPHMHFSPSNSSNVLTFSNLALERNTKALCTTKMNDPNRFGVPWIPLRGSNWALISDVAPGGSLVGSNPCHQRLSKTNHPASSLFPNPHLGGMVECWIHFKQMFFGSNHNSSVIDFDRIFVSLIRGGLTTLLSVF